MAKPNKGSRAAESLRTPWRPPEDAERRSAEQQAEQQGRATFHLPEHLLNEMRNAVVELSGPPHRLTMSKLAQQAIRRELDRLSAEHRGDGAAGFSQRAAEVTRGRPLR